MTIGRLQIEHHDVDQLFEAPIYVLDSILADAWELMTFGGVKVPGALLVNMDSWEWVVGL